jgi:hypothetical protein
MVAPGSVVRLVRGVETNAGEVGWATWMVGESADIGMKENLLEV